MTVQIKVMDQIKTDQIKMKEKHAIPMKISIKIAYKIRF